MPSGILRGGHSFLVTRHNLGALYWREVGLAICDSTHKISHSLQMHISLAKCSSLDIESILAA
jgi:hypothetical protein